MADKEKILVGRKAVEEGTGAVSKGDRLLLPDLTIIPKVEK